MSPRPSCVTSRPVLPHDVSVLQAPQGQGRDLQELVMWVPGREEGGREEQGGVEY
jgi:hypothetical protein